MALTPVEAEGALATIGRQTLLIQQLEAQLNQQTALIAEKNTQLAELGRRADELEAAIGALATNDETETG